MKCASVIAASIIAASIIAASVIAASIIAAIIAASLFGGTGSDWSCLSHTSSHDQSFTKATVSSAVVRAVVLTPARSTHPSTHMQYTRILTLSLTRSTVMGCTQLDEQLRSCGSNMHVFGHSHLPVDTVVDGVRYVQ